MHIDGRNILCLDFKSSMPKNEVELDSFNKEIRCSTNICFQTAIAVLDVEYSILELTSKLILV